MSTPIRERPAETQYPTSLAATAMHQQYPQVYYPSQYYNPATTVYNGEPRVTRTRTYIKAPQYYTASEYYAAQQYPQQYQPMAGTVIQNSTMPIPNPVVGYPVKPTPSIASTATPALTPINPYAVGTPCAGAINHYPAATPYGCQEAMPLMAATPCNSNPYPMATPYGQEAMYTPVAATAAQSAPEMVEPAALAMATQQNPPKPSYEVRTPTPRADQFNSVPSGPSDNGVMNVADLASSVVSAPVVIVAAAQASPFVTDLVPLPVLESLSRSNQMVFIPPAELVNQNQIQGCVNEMVNVPTVEECMSPMAPPPAGFESLNRAVPGFGHQSPMAAAPAGFVNQSPMGGPPPEFGNQSPMGAPPAGFVNQSPMGGPPPGFGNQSPMGAPPTGFVNQSPMGGPPSEFGNQSAMAPPPGFGNQSPMGAPPAGFGNSPMAAPSAGFGNHSPMDAPPAGFGDQSRMAVSLQEFGNQNQMAPPPQEFEDQCQVVAAPPAEYLNQNQMAPPPQEHVCQYQMAPSQEVVNNNQMAALFSPNDGNQKPLVIGGLERSVRHITSAPEYPVYSAYTGRALPEYGNVYGTAIDNTAYPNANAYGAEQPSAYPNAYGTNCPNTYGPNTTGNPGVTMQHTRNISAPLTPCAPRTPIMTTTTRIFPGLTPTGYIPPAAFSTAFNAPRSAGPHRVGAPTSVTYRTTPQAYPISDITNQPWYYNGTPINGCTYSRPNVTSITQKVDGTVIYTPPVSTTPSISSRPVTPMRQAVQQTPVVDTADYNNPAKGRPSGPLNDSYMSGPAVEVVGYQNCEDVLSLTKQSNM